MLKDRKEIMKLLRKGHINLMSPDPVFKEIKKGDIQITNYGEIVETNIHIDGDITYKIPESWLDLNYEEFEKKWVTHHEKIKSFITNTSKALNWVSYSISVLIIIIAHAIIIPFSDFNYSINFNFNNFSDFLKGNLQTEIAILINGFVIYIKNHIMKLVIRIIKWLIKIFSKLRSLFI